MLTNSTFQKASQYVISREEEGQRLDNFLSSLLKGLPKSRIYRIIRKGEVRVNKHRVSINYRLMSEDCLRIPPMRLSPSSPSPTSPSAAFRKDLEKNILYEDEALMVINKPAGLAVHGGSGVSLGLIEALRTMRPDAPFLELVHRIDRDTSGCVLIAKKRKMLLHLHNCLQQGTIQKHYYALVRGQWRGGKLIEAPLKKYTLPSGERRVKVESSGKISQTAFRVLKSSKDATLLEASPLTGRTHQIRVHCAFMGHPILGDQKYGETKEKRLFLHAITLKVPLPDREDLVVSAPLPQIFQEAMEQIFKNNEESNGTSRK